MSIVYKTTITPDFVFLNWDLNGTVTLGDTTKNINEIVAEVAGEIKAKWDPDLSEMSFKDYIQKHAVTGDKYDHGIKEKQEAEIGNLLGRLKDLAKLSEENLKLYQKASELYEKLAKRYLNPEKQRATLAPYPSVKVLIDKMQAMCLTTVTLRTFGGDGPLVAEEFSKSGIPMTRKATFTEDGMQIEGEDFVRKGTDLLRSLQEMNTIGRDQFQRWKDNDRKAGSGKRIYCVKDAKFEGKTVLSIFFDDNLKKRKKDSEIKPADPQEQNIAFPVDIAGKETSWDDRGVIGIRVNPIKAALQDDYFVIKVNKQLIKRGFAPLPLS